MFEAEARYHDARALAHEKGGHPPHYAQRSREKAARWRAKRTSLDAAFDSGGNSALNGLIRDHLREIEIRVAADITRAFLHGSRPL